MHSHLELAKLTRTPILIRTALVAAQENHAGGGEGEEAVERCRSEATRGEAQGPAPVAGGQRVVVY